MQGSEARLVAAALLALVVVATVHGALAADLETQASRAGAVTVKVTPRNDLSGAGHWDFEVVLETHVVALDQDIAKSSVLVDSAGAEHPAVSWDGDPPGGHHRRGVLRFARPPDASGSIELRMEGIGGVPVRTFRWRLGR